MLPDLPSRDSIPWGGRGFAMLCPWGGGLCSKSAPELLSLMGDLYLYFCTPAIQITPASSIPALCSINTVYNPVFPEQNINGASQLRPILVLGREENTCQPTESRASWWCCWKGKRWENVVVSGVHCQLNFVCVEMSQVAARSIHSSVRFKVLDIATSIIFF